MKESFSEPAGQERGTSTFQRETMRGFMEHQRSLAEELYERDHPSAAVGERGHDFREAVMEYWIGNKYAAALRNMSTHSRFTVHPRLCGDHENITLSDVEYFLHNEELPER